MSGPVAFVESAGQVDAALAHGAGAKAGPIIALAPAAAARLSALGRPYLKPESLYSERELSALTDEILDAQSAWADFVDSWLQDRVPAFREAAFRPATLHLFYLKLMFDALRIRAHILNAVSTKLAPSRALFFEAPPLEPKPDLLFRESLNALCMPAWARARDVTLERLPPAGDERFDRPSTPAAARRLPSFERGRSLARRRALPAVLRPYTRARPSRSVLVWPEYDVEHLIGPLLRRGLAPAAWDRWLSSLERPAAPRLPPLAQLAAEERFSQPLRPEGLDLFEAARSRLSLWWERIVPECWGAYAGARARFRRERFKAVVVPFAETPDDAAVLQAAKAEKVPVFVYQHGGFAGACEYPAWEFVDLRHSDTMLFYGEGVAGHYRRRLERYAERRAAPVAVGSARLDALARRPRAGAAVRRRLLSGGPDQPLVLYFPTMHMAYRRYLCGGELPDVSHWELQRSLVEAFARTPTARLVYKPFEGCFASPIPALLAERLPSARVESGIPLPELVQGVDAVITDIPSTGLLEALLTDKPVLVYADERSIRMTEHAKTLLRRRARLEETPEAFAAAVEDMLRARDFAPRAGADRSFLKEYGTHLDDGRSAERAADAVAGAAA